MECMDGTESGNDFFLIIHIYIEVCGSSLPLPHVIKIKTDKTIIFPAFQMSYSHCLENPKNSWTAINQNSLVTKFFYMQNTIS
jgi:hypothetical protein